ncbi:(S)-2-haloacid dehalogenase 4A [Pseudocercospora fuligena]|uniref:(S)-2-haloacid dehalogenase 4A n=1 Tax=Pseudocercospora fuligena TaxID=685502 RepID=A0A8H6RNH8_9PEZI|nr:(S)-2-haloacid dehalogenase 4A [Pseudocercospora fuligena]
MQPPPDLKVLFFDVFGTCVNQTTSIAGELSQAAKEALESNDSSITEEIREKASKMTYDQWLNLAIEWNFRNTSFVSDCKKHHKKVDWKEVDEQRISLFSTILVERGLSSFWTPSQTHHLATIWHRLSPWPDTTQGLELLNTKYITATLSNTYHDLMMELVSTGKLPFNHVFTADQFESYKPDPRVYLGAAKKLGLKPSECGLVAAHLGDLNGAKSCGFGFLGYVERELEEKEPELKEEDIPDLVVGLDEGGFVGLAERLGVGA